MSKFSAYSCLFQTSQNKAHIDGMKRRLTRFNEDPERDRRLERGECKFCYYLAGRIGGQAMTTSSCLVCEERILNSSTCIGKICVPCSQEHNLCTHCGADIELRSRRRKFEWE